MWLLMIEEYSPDGHGKVTVVASVNLVECVDPPKTHFDFPNEGHAFWAARFLLSRLSYGVRCWWQQAPAPFEFSDLNGKVKEHMVKETDGRVK